MMAKEKYLIETKNRIIRMMNAYDLNHDKFMIELNKYNGVIAGSFTYINFFPEEAAECNDIDIFIYQAKHHVRDYHPFESYLVDYFNCEHIFCQLHGQYNEKDDTHNDIHYARVYKTNRIDINFILINKPCASYISENFDLDCCKIIYDGNNVCVHDFESLMNHKTNVKTHKCDCQNNKTTANFNIGHFSETMPFIKLLMFFDVYKYLAGDITNFPTYNHVQIMRTLDKMDIYISNKYCALQQINLYTKIICHIEKTTDIDSILKSATEISNITVTDQILSLINMIITLERVEKYRKRGMVEFIFSH